MNHFDKLPSELISHIFLLCIRHWPDSDRWDPYDFNVGITSVCRRWRDIALSTSSMWQYITLLPGDVNLYKTKLCLNRSKGAPLDIHLSSYDLFSLAEIDNFLDVLLPHSSRWREFKCTVDDYVAHVNFLSRLHNYHTKPRILETLVLHADEMSLPIGFEAPRLDISFFSHAHSVSLRGLTIQWENWPFANLTQLQLRGPDTPQFTLTQFSQMLSSALSLVDLSLVQCHPSQPHTSPEPVVLPLLRSFRLERLPSVIHAALLMQSVKAPSLETLVIRYWSEVGEEELPSSIRSSITGYASIKHLNIGMLGTSSAQRRSDYEHIFRSFAGVTDLTLYFETSYSLEHLNLLVKSEHTLGPSTDVASPSVLLPSLNSLRPIGFPYGALHSFVKTRKEIGYPVRRIVLPPYSWSGVDEGFSKYLDVIDHHTDEFNETYYGEDAESEDDWYENHDYYSGDSDDYNYDGYDGYDDGYDDGHDDSELDEYGINDF
ncbi:uncharacterized protein EI90DRAFT_3051672 [Cantharellus anzutake]|uniref:uncharacterized protein n=1 Tax=Cantharellus anzutake TaxID=1750568 RepID=UPI0019066F5B|nr:uncharacterized protein EI90DRAFT_3051672 [Cantharellus anzutake]KAF8334271.1 hypothetical protein EI90DRAFT_3051672 [Cantharellus anzutake]